MTTPLRLTVCLSLLAAVGCSRSGGPVALSGKVRCGGKPVPPGTLYFVKGSTIVGKVRFGADGSYFVANLPPGELGIAVNFKPPAPASTAQDAGRTAAIKQFTAKAPPGGPRPTVSLVHTKPLAETDFAKKLADAHGNVANPAYRITVDSAPAEQSVEINFPTP